MTDNRVETIAKDASQLERRDRVSLIEKLLDTLEPESPADPSQVEAEWRAEVKRRSEDLSCGKETAIPWEQVKDEGEQLFHGD